MLGQIYVRFFRLYFLWLVLREFLRPPVPLSSLSFEIFGPFLRRTLWLKLKNASIEKRPTLTM